MRIFNAPIRGFFTIREDRLKKLKEQQIEMQQKWFSFMIENGSKTQFGSHYGMTSKWNYDDFCSNIPLQTYNSLSPLIQKVMRGEDNVLWNTKISWVAKSSGTTSSKSKFIPVSSESLKNNNYLAARDCLTSYCTLFPETEIFAGKGVMLGGSIHDTDEDIVVKCGDVSAILMNNMPILGDFLKAPSRDILLGRDWNIKLQQIAQNTVNEDITSLSGVPSWMLLVLKEVLKISGKEKIIDVWPNLEVYFHGGVSFIPYKKEYQQLIGKEDFNYFNMYNASEGFFGFQDEKMSDELLLLADHGIYYEFIPIDEIGNSSQNAVLLGDVELNKVYELVITTLAGLWRYKLGDTIQFTSLNPYRFIITGRTTHFINTFGEEVVVDNSDKAIKKACQQTQATFAEYTVAPVYLKTNNSHALHQWLIEFTTPPENNEAFVTALDNSLKELNSDYEAKRTDDLILHKPQLIIAPNGLFMKWLELKKKLGGQYKVPRLQNDRKMMDELLNLIIKI